MFDDGQPYKDLPALQALLESHDHEFAAVIMEPMSAFFPDDGYLAEVKKLVHAHGALLILDETITGFRFHLGGAQTLFDVTPDLATFGKGMGNGHPISAVVGGSEIMQLMEEIFFSGTFGGETLSLAATNSVLVKLERDNVPDALAQTGTQLQDNLARLIQEHNLEDVFSVSGHPSWSFLHVSPTEKTPSDETRTLLLQELFASGILFLGTHNLSAAHSGSDIERLLSVYEELLPRIGEQAIAGSVRDHLRTEPLVPLFKVR